MGQNSAIVPAMILLSISGPSLAAQTTAGLPSQTPSANDSLTSTLTAGSENSYADLTLGGYPILRLRSEAGGMTPQERVDRITERLTPLLGIPVIQPSDIVVYLPPASSHINHDPVIYALGRRLITVDEATVKAAEGGGTPLQVAEKWGARLQQVLPRVNWRPPNMPEPHIPPHPPLIVTHELAEVGGNIGVVSLRNKVVLKLRGPQPSGMTAAERADMLTARLDRLADQPGAAAPDAVKTVTLADGKVSLMLAGKNLITISLSLAKASGFSRPIQLAQAWAKNLRAALELAAPAPLTPTQSVPTEGSPATSELNPDDPTPPVSPTVPEPVSPQ